MKAKPALFTFAEKPISANFKITFTRKEVGYLMLGLYGGLFGWLFWQSYFVTDFITWLGVIIFPYVLIVRQKGRYGWHYGLLTLVLALLSAWLNVRTLQFGLLAVGLLFAVESFIGKTNPLPLLLVGVLSPFFRYLSQVFSFPVRLQLSEWAGNILSVSGLRTEVAGNIIRTGGTDFAVDPACMGLEMTETSLLMAIFLLAHYERKTVRQLSFGWLLVVAACTLGLNAVSNMFRIIVLVLFRILPENPMHDAVGMACLCFYVVVPLIFAVQWLYAHKSRMAIVEPLARPAGLGFSKHTILAAIHLLLVVFMAAHIFLQPKREAKQLASIHRDLPGMTRKNAKNDVVQFSNDRILLYVKPIAAFYHAEHSPLVCWRGSGYVFKQVGTQKVDGMEIYSGILQKGREQVHAAWWFDNGRHQTIRQLDWRWRTVKGEKPFCLVNVNVNVNVNREDELETAVRWALAQKVVR